MSVLLVKLRHAPDDEIAEICGLLEEQGIDFYQTRGGNWGISAPAIWLRDASQKARAKALLDDYQQSRLQRVRGEYERLKQSGEQPTLGGKFRENPLQFVVYVMIAGLILYFTVSPFFPN